VWASSADYTGDVAFSREIVDMAGQRLQRYRVLLKFVLGNIDETTKTIDSFAREDLNLVGPSLFLEREDTC
jgi:isoleucyl-tRNA synthetase